MRVHVLDLIGGGGFAKIRCSPEKSDTGLLRQGQRCRHGSQEQAAEVIDVDTVGEVCNDGLHARGPIALFCTHECYGFAGFVRKQVSDHPNRFGQANGKIGGDFGHFLQCFGFDADLDAFAE